MPTLTKAVKYRVYSSDINSLIGDESTKDVIGSIFVSKSSTELCNFILSVGNKKYKGILRLHLPMPEHKALTIIKDKLGRLYIVTKYNIDTPNIPLKSCLLGKSVGIDVGLNSLAVLSDGTEIANIEIYASMEKNIKSLMQQRDSITDKESSLYKEVHSRIRKMQMKASEIRKDYIHKVTHDITNKGYSAIFMENLDMKNMLETAKKSKRGRKRFNDVGWGMFYKFMEYKCAERGIIFFRVKPTGTSKICSKCNYYYKDFSTASYEHTYICPQCGNTIPRDLNAAINIKQRGIDFVKNIVASYK